MTFFAHVALVTILIMLVMDNLVIAEKRGAGYALLNFVLCAAGAIALLWSFPIVVAYWRS